MANPDKIERQTLMDLVECGMVDSWAQRAPKVGEAVTFASSYRRMVDGIVTVSLVPQGLSFHYRADEEYFEGVKAMADRPIYQTARFNEIIVSDAAPLILSLACDGEPITWTSDPTAHKTAANLANLKFIEKMTRHVQDAYPEVEYSSSLVITVA